MQGAKTFGLTAPMLALPSADITEDKTYRARQGGSHSSVATRTVEHSADCYDRTAGQSSLVTIRYP